MDVDDEVVGCELRTIDCSLPILYRTVIGDNGCEVEAIEPITFFLLA